MAAFVEPGAAARLARAVPALPGLRPVPSENLHLTLLFLGRSTAARGRELAAYLKTLQGSAVTVRVTGVTGFPSARNARALVALTDDPGGAPGRLQTWHDALVHRFSEAGPGRRFRPHITLGRSRRRMPIPEVAGLEGLEIPLLPPGVYESRTLPEGARYLPLRRESP